jgi:hypothetical protein
MMMAEDLMIPMDITDAWIDRFMAGQPPCKVAAARAIASSKFNGGALFKITCRDAEEAVEVSRHLAIMVTELNLLADKDRPSSKGKDGWPVLELKNGSGIMIVISRKAGDPSKGKT